MARHRDVRNLDYDQEYDEAYDDAVYGHSVDDHEYGVSPSAEQYLYSQKGDVNYGFGAYFPGTEKIKEEEEDSDEPPDIRARRDSSNFERPRLSTEDEVKLNSVLDELRNVVGDQFSEAELVRATLEHNFDLEGALNSILNRKAASSRPKSQSQQSNSRAKKEVIPIYTQPDDNMSLCRFAYMLPLSYSFASAFSFETDKRERIPINKIVKEWYSSVTKNKVKSDKLNAKEQTVISTKNIDEGIPINNRVYSDSTDSISNENKTSTESEEDSSINNGETTSDKCNENEIKDINDKLQNSHLNDSQIKNPLPIKIEANSNVISKAIGIPSLRQQNNTCDGSNFSFAVPSSRSRGYPSGFGSPTYSSSPKESFSPETRAPSLASLSSAHLNEAGKSISMGINKLGSSPISFMGINKLSSSPLSVSPFSKQSNLSALASAHLGQRLNTIGNIPSLNSATERDNVPVTCGFNSMRKSSSSDFSSFHIPQLQRKHAGVESENTTDLESEFSNLTKNNIPNLTFKNKFSKSNNGQSNSEMEDFISEDHSQSTVFDLNIALLKNKEPQMANDDISIKDEKPKSTEIYAKLLESIPEPLSKKESAYLIKRPSKLGNIILKDKKKGKQHPTFSRNVAVPFRPFDFSSRSPDDIVQEYLKEKKKRF